MNCKRTLVFAVLGIAGFLIPASSSGPAAAASQASAASAAGLSAANALIALPWPGLVQQNLKNTQKALAALDGKKFVDASTGYDSCLFASPDTIGISLATDNMNAGMAMGSPPGFTAASLNGFSLQAPLSGSWSLGINGAVHPDVHWTVGCHAGKGSVGGNIPFAFSVSNIHLAANATLNSLDPSRPKLVSGTVQLQATIDGDGVFPSLHVNLSAARNADGTVSLVLPATNLSTGLGSAASIHLTTRVVITVSPYPTTVHAQIGSIVDLSATFLPATIDVRGQVSANAIGQSVKASFDLPIGGIDIPTTQAIDDALELLGGQIPIRWPPAGTPVDPNGVAPSPSASIDFTTPRDTLENGIAAHMPYGAVLSFDYPNPNAPHAPGAKPKSTYTYGLDADSTIWTGHYLAAEAFRYAATHSPDALARVKAAIGGLQRDFDVTTDAVVENGAYTPVTHAYNGVFARSTLPANDPHGWTDSLSERENRGACLYVKAAAWQVGNRKFPTLAGAKAAGVPLSGRTIHPMGRPGSPVLYGTGCGNRGDDSPISRDQYSGVFMGLAYADVLVPDPDVQSQAKALIERALDYVLANHWNVPLPPDGTIITSFIGDFDSQLDLLRIGASVDPAKYGATYAQFAPASELVWIPTWFSTIDPFKDYFKFNLGHAFLGPTLFLEQDPALRANYLAAYDILRAATVTHRNAWFDMVDILTGARSSSSPSASNPALSLGDEIKSDLNDWITRWNAVKGPDAMPRNATSQLAANYQVQRWPGDVRLVTRTDGQKEWVVMYPMPAWARKGDGMDFFWQRPPFEFGLDAPGSSRRAPAPGGVVLQFDCGHTPPPAAEIAACSTDGLREGPGVDYLLPYWAGVYLHVLPAS